MHNLTEYHKSFNGKSGFHANAYVVNGTQLELYTAELLLDEFIIYWGKEGIPAILSSLWETMGSMLRNVGVMKFCNPSWLDIIMTWCMNLLTLSYPLWYANRLVIYLQGKQ